MVKFFIFDLVTLFSALITVFVPAYFVHWKFVNKNFKASALYALYLSLATGTVFFILTQFDFFINLLDGFYSNPLIFTGINVPTIMYGLVIAGITSASAYLLSKIYKVGGFKQQKIYWYIGIGVFVVEIASVLGGFAAYTLSIVGGGI